MNADLAAALHRYASLRARVEAAGPDGARVLASEGLTPETYQRLSRDWQERVVQSVEAGDFELPTQYRAALDAARRALTSATSPQQAFGPPPSSATHGGAPTGGAQGVGTPTVVAPNVGAPTVVAPTVGAPTVGAPTVGAPTAPPTHAAHGGAAAHDAPLRRPSPYPGHPAPDPLSLSQTGLTIGQAIAQTVAQAQAPQPAAAPTPAPAAQAPPQATPVAQPAPQAASVAQPPSGPPPASPEGRAPLPWIAPIAAPSIGLVPESKPSPRLSTGTVPPRSDAGGASLPFAPAPGDMALEQYAVVSAELALGQRAEVLAKHGLTEADWRERSKPWDERVQREPALQRRCFEVLKKLQQQKDR